MPNTLGTLATSLIVQRALELIYTMRPALRLIALDVVDRETGSPVAYFGQNVITRTFANAVVGDFGDAVGTRSDLDVSITLDKFKQVYHAFTPQQYSGTSRNLIEESAEPLAVAMANHMVDAVAALWTAANFTTTPITMGAGWDYDHLVDVRKTLNTMGVPDMRRYYIANSDVYASLLTDPKIVAAFNNPGNQNAITSGLLPNVAGLQLAEYPAMPTTGNMVGFAGYYATCIMACRVPKDPREVLPNAGFPGNIGIVTDPRTGLSVMVNEWIEPDTLNVNTRIVWMYGVAKGNETNNGKTGVLVISS